MKKSNFLTVKKYAKYIIFSLLAIVVIVAGLDHYHKYKAARAVYKKQERDIKGRVSAYFPKGSVVVSPVGGLGNQLFQYAAAHNLAKQTGSKLYVLTNRGKKDENIKENISIYDRNFALHNFNIPPEQIIFREDITKTPTKLDVKIVDDENFFQLKKQKNEGVLFLHAYFESEIYFEEEKEEVQNLFSLKHEDFVYLDDKLKDVSSPDAYCVHMRKGDMLRGNYMHYLPTEYQKQAIDLVNHIADKRDFFVFSDSLEVAKRDLQSDNLEFLGNKMLEDFWLMSHCGNNVVANSTFSWWAAYLNKSKSKTVIAPYHRYHDLSYYYLWEDKGVRYRSRRLYENSAYPKDWILLDYEKHDLVDLVKKKVPFGKQQDILKHYKEKPFNIYSGDGIELSLCKNEKDSGQRICKADHGKNEPTVVTAYFQVKNKHSNANFDEWMRNFLSVPFNLVVFTDKEHAGPIRKMRGDLPIKIIEKSLEDFYHYKYYDRYKEMYTVDHDKRHSPELYMIWAEKVKFVNEAIELDPYKSDFFIWTDIGMMREQEYIKNTYPTNTHMVSNKMSFFMIEDFSAVDAMSKAPRYHNIMMAGAPQMGDKFSWKLYNYLWDDMIASHLNKHFMITNDQAVIGAVVLTYPEIARIIYPDIRFTGNRWWYSLLYLSDKNFGE